MKREIEKSAFEIKTSGAESLEKRGKTPKKTNLYPLPIPEIKILIESILKSPHLEPTIEVKHKICNRDSLIGVFREHSDCCPMALPFVEYQLLIRRTIQYNSLLGVFIDDQLSWISKFISLRI